MGFKSYLFAFEIINQVLLLHFTNLSSKTKYKKIFRSFIFIEFNEKIKIKKIELRPARWYSSYCWITVEDKLELCYFALQTSKCWQILDIKVMIYKPDFKMKWKPRCVDSLDFHRNFIFIKYLRFLFLLPKFHHYSFLSPFFTLNYSFWKCNMISKYD